MRRSRYARRDSDGPEPPRSPRTPWETHMSRLYVRPASNLVAAGVLTGVTGVQAAAFAASHHRAPARHVLLISVDGLHQSDLAGYVSRHPNSALARLVRGGVEYTHAKTT